MSFNNTRNLIAACAAISVFGFAFGMTYPLLSLILEQRGVSSAMIGINAAMSPVGILLFSPIIPLAARRFGVRPTAIIAAIVTAAMIICYKLFDSLTAWFVIRLLQGMAVSTLFVLSESWIVKFAGGASRGRVVAIYGSILSASFGAGPYLIGKIGIEGWQPFILGAAVILVGIIPLFFVRDDLPAEDDESNKILSLFEFMPKAPMLLAAVLVFAIFDAATLSLVPVYGMQVGLDMATAANILTALIVGNVVLQFPIGWLADRVDKRITLLGCAVVTMSLLTLVPMVIDNAWRWPVMLIAGASGYGIYSVALAALGDRFSGHELVTGTAAFAVMWGAGALIGSVLGGWSMAIFGPHGLPGILAIVVLVFVIGMIVRLGQLKIKKEPLK